MHVQLEPAKSEINLPSDFFVLSTNDTSVGGCVKSCLILICFIFASYCLASNDDSLQQVLELHTKAMGGKQVIEKIKSAQIELKIEEPEFTVDGVYIADRNIRMRIDIYAGGKRVFTEGFNGTQGWQMKEDGKATLASPQGSAALRTGIFLPGKFFGLHELSALGHTLSYEGRDKADGISYHVLKLALDSKKQIFFYIHPDTGLIERTRDVKALHPDLDPTEKTTETVNSDFRKVDGTIRSFKSVQKDLKTGKTLQTTTVKSIKLNPVLDEKLFQMPTQ